LFVELVGRPFLVPHWALGFHQCHYGMNVGLEFFVGFNVNVE
jgi:alpha-glucosidase (family GH31 glycosyl hydrolase)